MASKFGLENELKLMIDALYKAALNKTKGLNSYTFHILNKARLELSLVLLVAIWLRIY